jgi:HTH-type transcriptional regulator/antitoxin HipB
MRLVSIADIAAAVRGRRMDLGLSQGDLAERAGVSRKWVNEFELGGKQTAEIGHVLRVIGALGLVLDVGTGDAAPPPDGIDLDAILDGYRRG